MKARLILLLFATCLGFKVSSLPFQNEKPKASEPKKSEASCDSYTEFKKKQKAKEASKQQVKR